MEENTITQIEQPTAQKKQTKKRNYFVIIIGIVWALFMITQVFNVDIFTSKEDKQYLSAAEDFICKILKNPYSATLHDSYVVEKDGYGRAIVYLDVTAENSFGGTIRNKFYVCILEVDNDGGYRHNGEFSYCEIPDTGSAGDIGLSYLKEMNNWGNPK